MARVRGVSFDFHDTVAICPTWFALEVRHLVSATHAWLVEANAIPAGPSADELDAAYRHLRLEIHDHGQEQDATRCVLTVFDCLGIVCAPELVTTAIETLMAATRHDLRPRPGIVEAIHHLSAAGLPIGITSNAVYHPFLVWALGEFGLTEHLTSIVTSASCGYYKSRPEIYQCTAEALGIPAADMVHVGDLFRFDVRPASKLGIRTVWLNLNDVSPPDDSATLVVTSLDGLADQLLAWA